MKGVVISLAKAGNESEPYYRQYNLTFINMALECTWQGDALRTAKGAPTGYQNISCLDIFQWINYAKYTHEFFRKK